MGTMKLIGIMAAFVVVGAPVIWILWEALNQLLLGHPGEIRFPVVLPVLLVFIGILVVLSRIVKKLDASR